jgi:hypothetical protein
MADSETLDTKSVNPMELKKRLAREIISQLYNEKDAISREHFARTVQKKETRRDTGIQDRWKMPISRR